MNGTTGGRTVHLLKVVPPYFDALLDGKTFEVRRNDRAFQRGDQLILLDTRVCDCGQECARFKGGRGVLVRWISFVYSGDPRWGGIEPGYVVLALSDESEPKP